MIWKSQNMQIGNEIDLEIKMEIEKDEKNCNEHTT